MASIGREGDKGERKRITYRDAAGKQKTLRLGRCSEKAAQSALVGLERVLEAHRLGTTLHPDAVRWLESIGDDLHERVVRLGLGVEPRKETQTVMLGELLERFESTAVVKAGTMTTYRQALAMLRDHFGESMPLADITPSAADRWRRSLVDSGLAPATIAKRVRVAKAVFRKAVRWGMLPSSPMDDLRAGSQANPDRSFYVDAETTEAVLDACPDDAWRAIVALSRFAGLRCPSEVGLLRWGDILWDRGRLTVRSPKTAGHEGHAVRVVPIDPRLRPILERLFEAAEPGTEAVVPRLRDPATNLRTSLHRILARAGVKPWPRAFHNMRASCATDWAERFPAHVAAGWLGHSPMIAATHYLQTRDAHFDLAAGLSGRGSKSGNSAAAKPAAHTTPPDATGDQDESQTLAGRSFVGSGSTRCDRVEREKVTPRGFEPLFSG